MRYQSVSSPQYSKNLLLCQKRLIFRCLQLILRITLQFKKIKYEYPFMSERKNEDRKEKPTHKSKKDRRDSSEKTHSHKKRSKDICEDLREKALAYERKQKFESAAKYWRLVAKKSKQIPDYQSAIRCYEKTGKNDDMAGDCCVDLSVISGKEEDINKGIDFYIKCLDESKGIEEKRVEKLFAHALKRRAKITGKTEHWVKAEAYCADINDWKGVEECRKNNQDLQKELLEANLPDFYLILEAGDYKKASIFLNQIGMNCESFLRLALDKYIEQKDFDNASWISKKIAERTGKEEDWRRTIQLQEKTKNKEWLASALIKLAKITRKEEDCNLAIRASEEIKNSKNLAFCYQLRAGIAHRLEDWDIAISIFKGMRDLKNVAVAYEAKAKVTNKKEDWNEAVYYYKEIKDFKNVAFCCIEKAKITRRKEDWDEAILYSKRIENIKNVAFCCSEKARVTRRKEDWDEAIICYKKILNFTSVAVCYWDKAEVIKNKTEKVASYAQAAWYYEKLNNQQNGRIYLSELAGLWNKIALLENTLPNWRNALHYAEKNGNATSMGFCWQRIAQLTLDPEDWQRAINCYESANTKIAKKRAAYAYKGFAVCENTPKAWLDAETHFEEISGEEQNVVFCKKRRKQAELTSEERITHSSPTTYSGSMFGERSDHRRSVLQASDKELKKAKFSDLHQGRMFKTPKKEQESTATMSRRRKRTAEHSPKKSKKKKHSTSISNIKHE